MSLYRQSLTPLRSLLIAWLLLVHVACVLSEAYAATVTTTAHDIHHAHGLYAADSTLHSAQVAYLQTDPTTTQQAESTDKRELAAETANHGCDHCQHCHAGHLGLFKASAALAPHHGLLSIAYQHPVPSCVKANIYRPPIA